MAKYNYNDVKIDEKVFIFIYGCALRDAILQKSYVGKRTWIGSDVPEAQGYVKDYINRVLMGDFRKDDETVKKDHDKAFLETAINVCNAINGYTKKPRGAGMFSFGNAQKLINMTVKHVYAHTYSIHTVGHSSIRECFRYCHCPMDSIMLSTIWKEYREIFDLSKRKILGSDFCKAWGNENFEADTFGKAILPTRYVNFQKAILEIIAKDGGNIFPIEYDYIAWNA